MRHDRTGPVVGPRNAAHPRVWTQGCVVRRRAGDSLCPRQDSNLRTCLRRAVLYPLSYGGARENTTRRADSRTPPSTPGARCGRQEVGAVIPVIPPMSVMPSIVVVAVLTEPADPPSGTEADDPSGSGCSP